MTVSFKEQHWNQLIYSSIAEVNIWPCIAPVTSSSAAKRSRWSSEEWVSPHLSIQGRAVPLPGGFGTSKEKEICTVCGLYKSWCLEQKLCKYLRGDKVCCCGETGTARLSSLPNALLVLFSVFKDGFLQLWCGPTAPAKKALCRWRPSTAPLVWINLPSKPRAGVLVSSGSSRLVFTEGKGVSSCTVLFIYIFSSISPIWPGCNNFWGMWANVSWKVWLLWSRFQKQTPQHKRIWDLMNGGIWWMEGLVEVCICRATGSIMQVEWYLHGDNALPRDLTPSNTSSLNPQLRLPAQPVSILSSREVCSFGGSLIIGEIMLWSHAFQQGWLIMSSCSCLYSGRAAAWASSCKRYRGQNLIAIIYLARSLQPLFRLFLSIVCYFAVVCLVGNGGLDLLILDLQFEKMWFGFSFLKACI